MLLFLLSVLSWLRARLASDFFDPLLYPQVGLTLIEAAVRSSAPAAKAAPPEYNFASFFRDEDAPTDDAVDAEADEEGALACLR
jgi:hypothetical protein